MKRIGDERDNIDYMTDMGYSANLLMALSTALKPEFRDMSIREFYGIWMKRNKLNEIISPYNFGVVIGELYCGLAFAKENWIELLPNIIFDEIDETFGIKTKDYNYPAKAKPTLKDIVRRMRNSLCHSNFEFEFSENKNYPDMFDSAFITFKDVNIKNKSDVFSIKLQVKQLKTFYTVYRDIVFKSIVEKNGGKLNIVDWSDGSI